MSVFLTKAIADRAIDDFFEEMFQTVLKKGRKGFHVVVLDPGLPYKDRALMPSVPTNNWYVLAERSCNEDEWDGSDYRGVAQGKSMLCLREKKNSADVPKHMLRTGDVKCRGGVYYRGIVVAVSGFEPYQNEKFALDIARTCESFALEAYDAWDEANPRESFV